MLFAVDLPKEVIEALDTKVRERRNKQKEPVWPFVGSVSLNTLSVKDKQKLKEYEYAMAAYRAAKEDSGRERCSRSTVAAEVIKLELARLEGAQ